MNPRCLLLVFFSVMWGVSALGCEANAANRPQPADNFQKEPSLMLWAWEYPCDLQFVSSKDAGVAFLAGRLYLTADSVLVRLRIESLKLNGDVYKMAVVRIETDQRQPPTFSQKQQEDLISKIIDILSIKPVQSLQIDFDARQSERSFYARVLQDLVKRLPVGMPLSITSLASWCLGDPWLKALPCNEVVPMFFSMGKDRERVLTMLKSDHSLLHLSAKTSIGLSIDEPDVLAALPKLSERIYLFSTKGWNTAKAINWVKNFQSGGTQWEVFAKNY